MKSKSIFVCQQCGAEVPKWHGKCPECGQWSSLVETVKEVTKSRSLQSFRDVQPAKTATLSEVKHVETKRLTSGFSEFDRVVGGGIVPGSVTLLAGDPGIGKSTLLLHILSHIGGFYASAEESAEQIKLRASRLGIDGKNITIASSTDADSIISSIDAWKAENTHANVQIVIIDSIQTIASSELAGMPGSVGQIRRCGELLTRYAKDSAVPVIIIGHVTKQGTIAGPKILEHMVDTVLYLEGERFVNARILRTFKNRFGAIEEVGIFEMKEKGLVEIDNPSKLFVEHREKNVPGSMTTVLLEGTRPILVEIQALVVPSQLAIPRRVASGVDINRLQLIVAVIQKYMKLPIGNSDVFVNVSGGMKVSEPSSDLAIALAIVSSFQNTAVSAKTVVYGELGLLGEVRRVSNMQARKKEAQRLGYKHVLDYTNTKRLRDGLKHLKRQ